MQQTSQELKLKVSTFASAKDAQAVVHESTLLELQESLQEPVVIEEDVSLEDLQLETLKESLPAWSPSVFSDERRTNDNVITASCIVFDLDTGSDGKKQGLEESSFEKLVAELKSWNCAWLLHTSFTSGFFHPRKKLRVVLPLAAPITAEEYVKLWDRLEQKLPTRADRTRRHPGGIFFAPAVLKKHKDFFTFMSDTQKPLLRSFSLNTAKTGDDRHYERVRTATEKHNAVNAAAFGIAAERFGSSEEQVFQEVWPKIKQALEQNTVSEPVRNWSSAENACRLAVKQGLARAKERAEDPLKNRPVLMDASEKRTKRAELDLKKWLAVVREQPERLVEAVTEVGRYVPHWLSEERVKASFLIEVPSAAADIEMGLAAGAARPVGQIDDWMQGLTTDKNGNIKPTDENCRKILRNHPEVDGVLSFNERTSVALARTDPPWFVSDQRKQLPIELHDQDAGAIAEWLVEVTGGTSFGARRALETALSVARIESFDPFADYLKNLKWDGTQRLQRWLVDYAGAEDTRYTRVVTEAWLTGLVARTFEPGCKMDNMLVLVGKQGRGKSSLLASLVPWPELFGDSLPKDERDQVIALSKYSVVEIAELADFRKHDNERIKHLLSGKADNVRQAYARLAERFPKRAVFAGTTNATAGFLTDPTGARRFWVVPITQCLPAASAAIRDQLLAEAVHRYRTVRRWHLSDDDELFVVSENEKHTEEDIDADILYNFVNKGVPKTIRRPVSEKDTSSLNNSGEVKLYYYSDQFTQDSDVPLYLTAEQVCSLLGIDHSRFSRRATELLTKVKWKNIGKRSITEGRIRMWVKE
jgi:predicted P-loop ATPase